MRFGRDDYNKYKGQEMYGRIVSYNKNKGYGFIYTEIGKEIFASSYNFKKNDHHVNIGDTVKFIPGKSEDRIIAGCRRRKDKY